MNKPWFSFPRCPLVTLSSCLEYPPELMNDKVRVWLKHDHCHHDRISLFPALSLEIIHEVHHLHPQILAAWVVTTQHASPVLLSSGGCNKKIPKRWEILPFLLEWPWPHLCTEKAATRGTFAIWLPSSFQPRFTKLHLVWLPSGIPPDNLPSCNHNEPSKPELGRISFHHFPIFSHIML